MGISFSDRQKIEQLKQIRADNNRVTHLYSRYLNHTPRFLTKEMVENIAAECQVTTEDAFRSLFSAACDLDTSKSDDRRLERDYLLPGLHRLDPEEYRNNAYCKTIKFPTVSVGKWSFKEEEFYPYEPFVCGDPLLFSDFREVPQIGFFEETYRFPSVLENGIEWMTVTPNEVETMKRPILDAQGRVLTFGLGLGYFVFHICAKEEVTSVKVIERDKDLIEMFRRYLLPQFPHPEKVTVICSDAYEYYEKSMCDGGFDFCFADLWHDPSDGLQLYLRFKKTEQKFPHTRFSYWIEPTLLSFLRDMVIEKVFSEKYLSAITSYNALEKLLSPESLRALAEKQ